jgi:two-component system phosphate regulon response regulator OmpR
MMTTTMIQLLMIDDDEKLVRLVREYLEPQGFRVAAAHDGRSGLDAVRKHAPELVILDLMLPELDGLEVCRRVREFSSVPVLMLTARGDEADRVVGLELGADDYLAKPFSARELLARIRAVLRRCGSERREPDGACRVGDLRIDPTTRRVHLGEDEVELTTAEFDLLLALAENAGRVLSRERLMEHVHGNAFAAYDRAIDVHVSRLRQKLEEDPRHPRWIKTVRGVGYQLAREDRS